MALSYMVKGAKGMWADCNSLPFVKLAAWLARTVHAHWANIVWLILSRTEFLHDYALSEARPGVVERDKQLVELRAYKWIESDGDAVSSQIGAAGGTTVAWQSLRSAA